MLTFLIQFVQVAWSSLQLLSYGQNILFTFSFLQAVHLTQDLLPFLGKRLQPLICAYVNVIFYSGL